MLSFTIVCVFIQKAIILGVRIVKLCYGNHLYTKFYFAIWQCHYLSVIIWTM